MEEADREALENKDALMRTYKEKKDRFDRAKIIKDEYGDKITAMESRVDDMADGDEKTAAEGVL